MRLLIASEAHFLQDAAGGVYAQGPEDNAFWAPYREVFDEVGILARLRPHAAPGPSARRADGDGVVFCPLDDYHGPWEYLARLPALHRQVRGVVASCDAFLFRVPGAVGYLAWGELRRRGAPYGIQVLGDPWDSLAPEPGSSSPLQALARRWSRNRLRQICHEAPVACYVTRSQLQRRYPPGAKDVFTCSDVRLETTASDQALASRFERNRRAANGERSWEIGFIGSLERLYKAPEVHLAAIAQCHQRGLDLRLSIVGEGRHRPALQQLAGKLGISDRVRFLGALPPGRAIEDFLDSIDLFLLASRTEGLPRALIEAMARGCPAIGSTAGGIPELLESGALIPPGSAHALATRVVALLGNLPLLESMARRNRAEASRFAASRLAPVRRNFLWKLRNSYT